MITPWMGRIFKHPELLFLVLVIAAPFPAARLWSGGTHPFWVRLLLAMSAGVMIWLAIILVFVWPRYRSN